MSKKILKVTLDDEAALINNKELAKIIVNSTTGSISFVDSDGSTEHIAVFDNVYDTNNDNVVDDSERLGGHLPSYYATVDYVNSLHSSGMLTTTYDTDNSGVVDDSEALGGHPPSYWASVDYANTRGDMFKSTYDVNNNGVVDDSEKLNNQDPSYYLDYTNFTNKPNLEDLENCNMSGLTSEDIIQYNGSQWVNRSVIDLGSF